MGPSDCAGEPPSRYSMSMKRFWMFVALAVVLASASADPSLATGPPPGLTENGRVTWNLDAFLNDTFGNRTVCFRFKTYTFFSVTRGRDCGFPPVARTYVFTFADAHRSAYRLVRLARYPNIGVLNAALRIGGRYIRCGPRSVLGVGGDEGPGAFAWCIPTD
jgi:hypothetical protein